MRRMQACSPTSNASGTDRKVAVWRGLADGAFSSYEVPRQASQTVLRVIALIQQRLEPSLEIAWRTASARAATAQ